MKKTPEDIAQQWIDEFGYEQFDDESPFEVIGFKLGESIDYEKGLKRLVELAQASEVPDGD